MIPRTLSASALVSAHGCMARYKAETFDRAARSDHNTAAAVGTTCHDALENYVLATQINKIAPEGWELLEMFYDTAYLKHFGADDDTDEYRDGLQMLKRWHARTDFSNREVLSVEVKETFPVPTSAGVIGFTYIWDRCDKLIRDDDEVHIVIVDYKSIRANLSADELYAKIQARAYSVAARIKFANLKPDRIYIEFDLLRYAPVTVMFSRTEDLKSYEYIKAAAEKIIAADEENPEESISHGCRYCVRKTNCETLASNVSAGGTMSLGIPEVASKLATINNQMTALKYAANELEQTLLDEAKTLDVLEFEAGDYIVRGTAKREQKVDAAAVQEIVGPEIMMMYGSVGVTVVNKMMKEAPITEEQKAALKATISTHFKELSVKVVSNAEISA